MFTLVYKLPACNANEKRRIKDKTELSPKIVKNAILARATNSDARKEFNLKHRNVS